ncbi:MAG: flagellar motor protein MotB, partial [Bacillota bacterium]
MSRKKRHSHEEHIDETWLIPYADLLTLLLALFIVLFASSQIDAKKLGDMRQVFNAIFAGNVGVMNQSSTIAGNSPNTTDIPNGGAQDPGKITDARNEALQLMQLQRDLDKYIQQN